MVLANGTDPTIATVCDMEGLARPDKVSLIMHKCSDITDVEPRPKPQGPKAAGPQAPAQMVGSGPNLHSSQSPMGYKSNGGMIYPVVCEQGYEDNRLWIWTYPVWDPMLNPVLMRVGATFPASVAFPILFERMLVFELLAM